MNFLKKLGIKVSISALIVLSIFSSIYTIYANELPSVDEVTPEGYTYQGTIVIESTDDGLVPVTEIIEEENKAISPMGINNTFYGEVSFIASNTGNSRKFIGNNITMSAKCTGTDGNSTNQTVLMQLWGQSNTNYPYVTLQMACNGVTHSGEYRGVYYNEDLYYVRYYTLQGNNNWAKASVAIISWD